ncbi:hypothetical protein MTO96_005636 [Rhipicephalus appendiculatus]
MKWRRVLQAYIDAAAPDATPERKKALLLNALGGRKDWTCTTRLLTSRRSLTVNSLPETVRLATRTSRPQPSSTHASRRLKTLRPCPVPMQGATAGQN